MDVPIEPAESGPRHGEEERTLAYTFSARIAKELGRLCRAIVLFGSAAQHLQAHPSRADSLGDIDIMVILDDVTIKLTDDILTGYRVIVENTVNDVSPRLHVTTVTFTTFYEYVRVADPVMVNILRSGEALLDTGFFEPFQALLRQGRIRPTTEAIWAYYLRAPQTLLNSQGHIMQAALDLYWACIDAAHAAIMAAGETPVSPKQAAGLLRHLYVEKGLLEERYAQTMEHFYELSKDIIHRRVATMSAEYYDELYAEAKAFVDRMRGFLPATEPEGE